MNGRRRAPELDESARDLRLWRYFRVRTVDDTKRLLADKNLVQVALDVSADRWYEAPNGDVEHVPGRRPTTRTASC